MPMIVSENVEVTGSSDIIKITESIDAGDSHTIFPQATSSQRFSGITSVMLTEVHGHVRIVTARGLSHVLFKLPWTL